MIRTRFLFGSLLGFGATGLLIADMWLAPWYPCLFICLMIVGIVATRELVQLFPKVSRPNEWFAVAGVLAIFASNFALPFADPGSRLNENFTVSGSRFNVWEPVLFTFVALFLLAILVEMYRYREPGTAIPRLAFTLLAFAYIGLLGSFLAQLRWLGEPGPTSTILALAIFVPKYGDIGAFFTGKFLGRHKMTPILSPKKTWEGFAGGMVLAMITAIVISYTGNVFRHGILEAAIFGLIAGIAGVLGDLAESLIKRDGLTKDASRSIPGFGGLLDVMDSILFAAPVTYLWFRH